MENKSKYSWVLVGFRTTTGEKLPEEKIQNFVKQSFDRDNFQLFLCGALVDKYGSLVDMENGLDLILNQMKDYHDGDYCIISTTEDCDLLFCPTKEI